MATIAAVLLALRLRNLKPTLESENTDYAVAPVYKVFADPVYVCTLLAMAVYGFSISGMKRRKRCADHYEI